MLGLWQALVVNLWQCCLKFTATFCLKLTTGLQHKKMLGLLFRLCNGLIVMSLPTTTPLVCGQIIWKCNSTNILTLRTFYLHDHLPTSSPQMNSTPGLPRASFYAGSAIKWWEARWTICLMFAQNMDVLNCRVV